MTEVMYRNAFSKYIHICIRMNVCTIYRYVHACTQEEEVFLRATETMYMYLYSIYIDVYIHLNMYIIYRHTQTRTQKEHHS